MAIGPLTAPQTEISSPATALQIEISSLVTALQTGTNILVTALLIGISNQVTTLSLTNNIIITVTGPPVEISRTIVIVTITTIGHLTDRIITDLRTDLKICDQTPLPSDPPMVTDPAADPQAVITIITLQLPPTDPHLETTAQTIPVQVTIEMTDPALLPPAIIPVLFLAKIVPMIINPIFINTVLNVIPEKTIMNIIVPNMLDSALSLVRDVGVVIITLMNASKIAHHPDPLAEQKTK